MQACELKTYLSARLLGDDVALKGLNAIDLASDGDLSFIIWPQDIRKAKNTKASCLVMSMDIAANWADELACSMLAVDDVSEALLTIANLDFFKRPSFSTHIDNSAVIAPNVTIEDSVIIGAQSIINAGSVIKSHSIIGNNVTIGCNSVIGSAAFAPFGEEKLLNLPSLGFVEINNNCFIGDFVSIAKGILSKTSLGENCFIDNMTHIGHDTSLGKNVIIAAQSGIAGFVRIENDVTVLGQAGIGPFVVIKERARITGGSKVFSNVPKNSIYSGYPAIKHSDFLRLSAYKKRK